MDLFDVTHIQIGRFNRKSLAGDINQITSFIPIFQFFQYTASLKTLDDQSSDKNR
jgi:uncharacterized protein YhbP (UPF0306 family)